MDVFVYGPLTDPAQAAQLLDEFELGADAVLDGLHRVSGTYPTLSPGGQVEGRILRTPDIEALDAYEGFDRGLYVRVEVPCESDERAISVYVGDADALGAVEMVRWPGSGSFEERIRGYIAENGVSVRFRG